MSAHAVPTNSSRRFTPEYVQLVVRIDPALHDLRNAVAQGLHHLPLAPPDIFAAHAAMPVSARRRCKLRVSLEQKSAFDRIAAAQKCKLWVAVSATLACVRNAPAGDRSAALAGARRAAGRGYLDTP